MKGPHRFVCLSSWWNCFGSLLNLFETARGSGSLGGKLREWDRWLWSSFPFPGDMANPLHTPPMPCFPQSETEIKQVCLKLLLLRSPWQAKWLTCRSIFHWFCLKKKNVLYIFIKCYFYMTTEVIFHYLYFKLFKNKFDVFTVNHEITTDYIHSRGCLLIANIHLDIVVSWYLH